MPEIPYVRLTRARSRSDFGVAFVSRASLWLGSDHLLLVDSNGYTETYKRFRFRDIQAISIRETTRRKVWAVVWLTLAFLCMIPGLTVGGIEALIVFASIAAGFVVALLINVAAGPTCICHLHTAVQSEELSPLKRLRSARRFLHRLRPFITQAQGEIAPGELSTRLRDLAAGGHANELSAGAEPKSAEELGVPPQIAGGNLP